MKTINGEVTDEQEKAAVSILSSIGLSGYRSWSKGVIIVVPRDGIQDVRAFMNDIFDSVAPGRAGRDVEALLFTRNGSKKYGSDWTERIRYSTWEPSVATLHYSNEPKPLAGIVSDSGDFSYAQAYNFALNVFPNDRVAPDTSSIETGIDEATSEQLDDLPGYPETVDWSALSDKGASDEREQLLQRLPALELDNATIGALFAYYMATQGAEFDKEQAIAGISDALNYEISRIRFSPKDLSSVNN